MFMISERRSSVYREVCLVYFDDLNESNEKKSSAITIESVGFGSIFDFFYTIMPF